MPLVKERKERIERIGKISLMKSELIESLSLSNTIKIRQIYLPSTPVAKQSWNGFDKFRNHTSGKDQIGLGLGLVRMKPSVS
jgi:hypothetical protein